MYNYPAQGRMSFEHNGLTLTQPAKIKIIVDTPLDNADTNRKLAELLTL
ncbi:hypothetical protein HFO56_14445 [Rhizobium laguerreae]|nr:hypothetical protein [Rhizobium laguerreae]